MTDLLLPRHRTQTHLFGEGPAEKVVHLGPASAELMFMSFGRSDVWQSNGTAPRRTAWSWRLGQNPSPRNSHCH